jgi:hypothetical protein
MSAGLAARVATRADGSINRLVLYAAPAIGRCRMPLRLRYVRAAFRDPPHVANAVRFDRFTLLDLDATRRRDPEWCEAFDAYTRARAREPHVKKRCASSSLPQTKPIEPTSRLGLGLLRHPVACGHGAATRARS